MPGNHLLLYRLLLGEQRFISFLDKPKSGVHKKTKMGLFNDVEANSLRELA
jgi:hypothetical protein